MASALSVQKRIGVHVSTFQDLTNCVFDRLTVIECAGRNRHSQALWRCRCSCDGKEIVVQAGSLRSGNTKSCGCIRAESLSAVRVKLTGRDNPNFKHGHGRLGKHTPEYHSWQAMTQRCLNSGHEHFKDYGGRGITICKRWRGDKGFENFLSDMGSRPERMTLDRWPDNNGHYEPENCRWATRSEQNRNKRPRKRKIINSEKEPFLVNASL